MTYSHVISYFIFNANLSPSYNLNSIDHISSTNTSFGIKHKLHVLLFGGGGGGLVVKTFSKSYTPYLLNIDVGASHI